MQVSKSLSTGPAPLTHTRLKNAAIELEAAFLSEMLKSAGLAQTRQSFGGGVGEDQFGSLLVQHQAQQLAQSGGVGLSEILLKSLMEKADDI
ncbi:MULTISPECIES: rod-binding protein [unclassified Ruegeria]|uniref:rod-binding protein n=1 Tax=unclassified Ruegeria TaxID=2625375 RepID=UPI0014898262|nr:MULTISPECIES: rod-binding protein [unclassified Ruegeria]NOD78664.1 flagellar biosynthesis protein FlgJ [Ruegeria sp. HKCCD4332]NOD90356.1 flagellar biosynthesis protein FlgJ [Ruegeria sp. HKCCD4318]NOD94114.1 flagellar biosynthesis protein FlgJ [Ruegeria sp. HKCCD4884]NOE15428.1 flagellar biosynthesis protein FlgJ [Ruegeria sp. HKCCD4318-2]NOG10358.1 flagellar biosynthesis protein FlgJ [Ruegeria sp. HKCCD4315]